MQQYMATWFQSSVLRATQACHVDAAWQLVAEKAGELLAARLR